MTKKLAISVSGGGALGIGPLHFMKRLEADLKINLANEAVALGGTSTGAIIASCLAEGYSADYVYTLYRQNIAKIFTKYPWYKRINPVCPMYDNENLKSMLKTYLKGKFSDWKKLVRITTTSMKGKSTEKVWDNADTETDKWFAVLTSTAAPTYFDVITTNGKSFADGGLWANNPIAVLNAGINRSELRGDIKILSFDTGMSSIYTAYGNMTLLGWAKYLLTKWIAHTSKSSNYEVRADIGDKNVFVASPEISEDYKMDDTSKETLDKIIDIWDKYYDQVKDDIKKFITEV